MSSLNKLSFGLLKDTKKQAMNLKNSESVALANLNLNDIIQVDFPENQYYKEQTSKTIIVLHHTVSGQGAEGDIAWWASTPDHVATAIVVDWRGKIYQCFSSMYWAYHLGLNTANNTQIAKASIGIEIDAWGALMRTNRQWYPVKWDATLNQNVPNTAIRPIQNVQVYENGFKGFYGFEKYTAEQIEAVRQLLVFWNGKYGIPLDYNEDMWALSNKALSGAPGVWTHVSYREDKSDCHPQPELLQMLKSLK